MYFSKIKAAGAHKNAPAGWRIDAGGYQLQNTVVTAVSRACATRYLP
jgi:hypothetical protein